MYDTLIGRPLTQSQRRCMHVELTFIYVAYVRWCHWRCGRTQLFRLQPSVNLHAQLYSLYFQLLWYPMYYPEGMEAWVSPACAEARLLEFESFESGTRITCKQGCGECRGGVMSGVVGGFISFDLIAYIVSYGDESLSRHNSAPSTAKFKSLITNHDLSFFLNHPTYIQ